MTFDHTLHDSSSFGKPCTGLIICTFAFKIHATQFSLTFTGNFQAYWLIFKLAAQLYQHSPADLSVVSRKQTPCDWQLIQIFSLMNKYTQRFHCCSLVLAYSFICTTAVKSPQRKTKFTCFLS